MLTYLEAILRVYNRYGRRDNIYKARIKILVKERGAEEFAREVESEWEAAARRPCDGHRTRSSRASPAFFGRRAYETLPGDDAVVSRRRSPTAARSRNWAQRNVHPHKVPGYAVVTLSLKKTGVPPGDVTVRADGCRRRPRRPLQLRRAARLARAEPDPRRREASATSSSLWQQRRRSGLATPNIGLLTNIICCPGGDFCSLANAKSIPIAEAIQRRFDDLDYLHDIGELDLNISRLHERLRPPPRRPHRHPRRRQERRRVVPGLDRRHAGRARGARQGDRAVVRRGRHARRGRRG